MKGLIDVFVAEMKTQENEFKAILKSVENMTEDFVLISARPQVIKKQC